MRTRVFLFTALGLILATGLYSVTVYSSLPQRVPIHWDAQGQVNGWGDRVWAAFLGPEMMVVFLLLAFVLPWLSPRNFKVDDFRHTFNYIMMSLLLLFGYIHVVALQAALHPQLNLGRMLISGICLFIALLGNVMGRVRRNFWLGIRTPWTLANDTVWIATHRLAARLMVAGGLLAVVALLVGAAPLWALVFIMTAMLIPVVYSLVLYKHMERAGLV